MSNISTFLIKQKFKNLYGERIYIIAYHLGKLYKKRTIEKQNIRFLIQCKQHNLVPNGFKLENTTNLTKNEKLLRQTMYKIRNNILLQKQLKYINIEISTQNSILNHYLKTSQPTRQHHDDLRWINKFNENFENNLIKKHNKKIKILKEKQVQQQSGIPYTTKTMSSKITYDASNVINISKIHLSQEQLQVRSEGLKFVATPTTINTITTVVNCEKSLFSTSKLIKSAPISEIPTFIQKWQKPNKLSMNKNQTKLLKGIKSIEDIAIVQAHNGGKKVVMNKTDNINKIEEKLKHSNIYGQVGKDPTTTIK